MERGRLAAALRVARAVVGLVDLFAIGTIAVTPKVDIVNLFSYFTIESNLIAIFVLLVGAIGDPRGPRWAYVRGAATLYLTITGIVYNTLLLNVSVGVTAAWVNDVVHRAVPLLLLLDWIVFSPWARTRYVVALTWLAYPLAYVAYTLIRGPLANWYPYPFLDPRLAGGYGRVAIYSVVLAIVFALLALAVNAIGRLRLRHS